MTRIVLSVCIIAPLLWACAPAGVRPQTTPAQLTAACAPLAPEDDVRLGLVRQMASRGRPYAALAHLDALDPRLQQSDPARYLRAEQLRQTGNKPEAKLLYRGLLNGCISGLGHHGLGLLRAETGEIDQAVIELRRAAQLLPTDARVRNDLGYSLLLSHDTAGARREFLTAVELGDYEHRAGRNLVLLLLYEGDESAAKRLARELHLSDADVEHIRTQAHTLKMEG